MAAMSSLRVVASSPSTRRFFYIGGMGATPGLRVVAAALPALPHAQRVLYAGEVGALSPLRFVAPASLAVARPRRLSTAVLPYMGSSCSRSTAAAPGLQANCLPPQLAEATEDLPLPPPSPTAPDMPLWAQALWALSSVTTERPGIHALAVLLLSGFKSTGFEAFVDWVATTFSLPPKFKLAILLGATVITVLFDAAVIGKDLNDVCSYMMTHQRKVPKADMEK